MPDQTLATSSLPIDESFPALKVMVSTRLPAPSPSTAALANLTSDLMTTSGGVLRKENEEVVAAGFSDVQSAIRAARRLQWALDGLTESEKLGNVSAVILIYSTESELGLTPSLDGVFAKCEPGQILLSRRADWQVDHIPGMRMRATRQEGWHELIWRKAEGPVTFADDERSVLRIIREAGGADPCPAAAELPMPVVAPQEQSAFETPSPALPVDSIGRRWEAPSFHGRDAKPWLILTGAAAMVCLVAVFFIASHHSRPVQGQTPSPPAAMEPKPAAPKSKPVARPPVQGAIRSTPSSVDQNPSKKAALAEPKPALGSKAVSCDLTEGDIQRSLARADRNLHDGNLADAEAEYRQVLGCPSARERAQEGLNRVAERKTAEDGGAAHLESDSSPNQANAF